MTLLFAFTISANAQDQKNYEEAAKKDAIALTEYLGLKETQQEDFFRLFKMKHETLQDPNISEERKNEMSKIVGLKIKASITPDQSAKLDNNPELMKQLQNSYLN